MPRVPDSPAPPSQVDALIADLESDGVSEGEGRFSLDRHVAREKVARFALPDPEDYVLLLVRSAVRQGARRIFVNADADELHMEWDGRPFTRQELEDLYNALLEGEPGAPGGLRELALALVTARALQLRKAEVRSGGPQGHALILRPEKPDAFEEVRLDAPGTMVYVRRALTREVVSREGAELAGALSEQVRLAQRCRYADLDIEVNGHPLQRDPVGADLEALRDVEGPGVDGGVAGIRRGDEHPGRVHVVRDGVWIDTIEAERLRPGFEAVVVADSLVTDLTGFKVVRDTRWAQVLATVLATQERVRKTLAAP